MSPSLNLIHVVGYKQHQMTCMEEDMHTNTNIKGDFCGLLKVPGMGYSDRDHSVRSRTITPISHFPPPDPNTDKSGSALLGPVFPGASTSMICHQEACYTPT